MTEGQHGKMTQLERNINRLLTRGIVQNIQFMTCFRRDMDELMT